MDQFRLAAGGQIFCTVPNRRTLFEILSRIKWKVGLALGHKFVPGEPHIQFNSPEECRYKSIDAFCRMCLGIEEQSAA
jgi:hypothetical protein